jgi:2-oxoglutarate dehydrogenase E2 component (dihydrolipoamide succinyltransferase)
VLIEVKVPILAESVADATLLEWYKKPGDVVKRGENLIDLETDKVTLEVSAPGDGVLTKVLKQTGETALSQETLAIIDSDVKLSAVASDPAPETPAPHAPSEPTEARKAGPAAEKIMREHAVEPAQVTPTGRGGRVTKGDVLRAVETGPSAAAKPAPATEPAAPPPQATPGGRPEQRVAMTRLRRRAAERLLAAQHENAILTTFNEVNMRPIMDLRSRYKERFEKRHEARLGFMAFFVKAAVEALKRFPIVNASVDGDAIIYHGYFDIGIAVGSERGLVVPILRDADLMSFADIERRINDFGARAEAGRLTIEELTGGTFTITNGGVFGSLLSTPILNPPQSGILGMHKIQERPVVEDGQVVVRPMMYLALSYDHRIIDGREAVQFLVTIKEQLEDPARMLIQI